MPLHSNYSPCHVTFANETRRWVVLMSMSIKFLSHTILDASTTVNKSTSDAFTGVEVLSLVQYGPHHLSVASALNCIGVVLFHTMEGCDNSSKDAIDALFEALSIRTSILGTEHKDVATTLNNIGRVYFDIGDYPKALLVVGSPVTKAGSQSSSCRCGRHCL